MTKKTLAHGNDDANVVRWWQGTLTSNSKTFRCQIPFSGTFQVLEKRMKKPKTFKVLWPLWRKKRHRQTSAAGYSQAKSGESYLGRNVGSADADGVLDELRGSSVVFSSFFFRSASRMALAAPESVIFDSSLISRSVCSSTSIAWRCQ